MDGRYTGLVTDEKYNRIWTRGVTPSNCIAVPTVLDSTTITVENDPPISVLCDSIVPSTFDSIKLSIDLPRGTPQPAYFVFYFTELASRPKLNDTRIVDININGQLMQTMGSEINQCKVVTLYPVIVAGPTINIMLAPNRLSTLPPMISAMEVFKKVEPDPVHETPSNSGTRERFVVLHIIFINILCLAALF